MTHTSISRVIESFDICVAQGRSVADAKKITGQMTHMLTTAPHYVFDKKIVDLTIDEKISRSMRDMVHAGIRQLPFDPMLVEFQLPRSVIPTTCFVRLQSKPMIPVDPKAGYDKNEKAVDLYAYVLCCRKDTRPENTGGLLIASNDFETPMVVKFTEPPAKVPFQLLFSVNNSVINEDLALTGVCAMLLSLFMLNTRGVAKERVDTGKLNKARAKAGKPHLRVNPYTVVKIGHIYDRSGKSHDVAGSGRHMPVHWRAGHVRHMRYGPAGPRNARLPKEERKIRPVFIDACLVNFSGEGTVPLPKHEVKL